MSLTRREFLQGCSLSIAALAGARLTGVAYAASGSAADTLVVISLRGGWDALNVVPPISGQDRQYYEAARPGILIPHSRLIPLNDTFGLHPHLSALHPLYQDGKLAIIHAVGLDYDTRSHFDAIEYIELGTPGKKSSSTGWMTRTLQTETERAAGMLPVVSTAQTPTSLLGNLAAVSMPTLADFTQWDNGLISEQQKAQRILYTGDSLVHQNGLRTLDTLAALAPYMDKDYVPENGATYRDDELGVQLRTVAQLMKMGVGLRAVTVDFGGWDTHQYQNDGENGYMGELLSSLGENLANFYTDLDPQYTQKLSVVVLSEFGRRLVQNNDNGTDHGHGGVMFALGGGVNGGSVYGQWPGLANEQLYDHADLAVTTDYRQVLSELLSARLQVASPQAIFPGFTPALSPLGLFRSE